MHHKTVEVSFPYLCQSDIEVSDMYKYKGPPIFKRSVSDFYVICS